jgi:hypothetical protein
MPKDVARGQELRHRSWLVRTNQETAAYLIRSLTAEHRPVNATTEQQESNGLNLT